MNSLLEVLICTTPKREYYFDRIKAQLTEQCRGLPVFASYNWKEFDAIGKKRNDLLQAARGKFICFIDDDDRISNDYIETVLAALVKNPNCDCLSLRGVMTTDGKNPETFEHSIKYQDWKTTENAIKYERYPNHLNVIRTDIARQFLFPETNFGEDHAWSKAVHESGLLKNEVYINKVLYYYLYRTKK